jgi:uncharacterized metal-binding protein
MHGAIRIVEEATGSIDSSCADSVTFEFEGEPVTARHGEPVAVALIAAGHRVFRTTPGSGEPRGGFCFTGRCADCMMVVDGVGNTRACVTPVVEGMSVRIQRGLAEWGAGS